MIYLEIVIREIEGLLANTKKLLKKYPQLSGINAPDIIDLPVRSYHAAEALLKEKTHVIPHIRAIDNELAQTVAIVKKLVNMGLKEVLVIKGDIPLDQDKITYPITTIMVVKELKRHFPDLKIYCGLDQYRDTFEKELEYCHAKQAAGADGFFTQPFFDKKVAEEWLQKLEEFTICLGVCPVVTEKNKKYWVTKNKAVFPNSFGLDLEYNFALAKNLLDLAEKYGQHAYLMPILVPADDFLKGVF
ncbi:methylenetetrahydrofolate reductase [Candidatus Margulisiibacteriota bacterium]